MLTFLSGYIGVPNVISIEHVLGINNLGITFYKSLL